MPSALFVIVNPTAGSGRAGRLVPWLRERLGRRPEASLEVTTCAGDAERLAAEAASVHDRIVAVGGDGTVQEIINGMLAAGAGASLGIVPTGSGNDLARSLGLPRDPAVAWSTAVGRSERSLDLALASSRAGKRWFGSAAGIGFDAQVAATMVRRRRWQSSRAGYLLSTLAELRRFDNREIELTVDGVRSTRTVLFVAIANGEFYGGGMRIAPGASTDDGLLDICIVGDISRATALRQLANLYRGTHVAHPQVELLQGRSLSIDGGAESLVHLDGEPFGGLPARVDIHPARLSVAVPQEVDGPTDRIRRAIEGRRRSYSA